MTELREFIELIPAIGAEAFAVYVCMMAESSEDGLCNLSLPEIQKMVGSSKPTVIRAIDKLEAAELITRQHRYRQSCVYSLSKCKSKKSLLFYPIITMLINNTEDIDIQDKSKKSLLLENDNPEGDLAPLADEYTSLTGMFVNTPRDIKALAEIKALGAQPGDIREAIETLQGKKYSFNGVSGLVTPIKIIITKRNLNKNGVHGKNSNGSKPHFAPAPEPAQNRPKEVILAEIAAIKARNAAAKAQQEAQS